MSGMKIYIAHLADGLAPDVRELGESLGAVFVDVTGDEFGYYRMLRAAWQAGESFINLEEDVLPTMAQLNELWQCPSDWCSLRYPYPSFLEPGQPPHLIASFGCVKFGGKLLQRDIWREPKLRNPVPWHDLDFQIMTTVREDPRIGPSSWRFAHVHRGPARHLSVEKDYPMLRPWRRHDFGPNKLPVGEDSEDNDVLAEQIVTDHLRHARHPALGR